MEEPDTPKKRSNTVAGNVRKVTLTGKVTVRSANGKSSGAEGEPQGSISIGAALGSLGAVAVAFGLIASFVQHLSISMQTGYPLFLATYSYLDIVSSLPVMLVATLYAGFLALLILPFSDNSNKFRTEFLIGLFVSATITFVLILSVLLCGTVATGILTVVCVVLAVAVIKSLYAFYRARNATAAQSKEEKCVKRNGELSEASSIKLGISVGFLAMFGLYLIAIMRTFLSLCKGIPLSIIIIIIVIIIAAISASVIFVKFENKLNKINLRKGAVQLIAVITLSVSAALMGMFVAEQKKIELNNMRFVTENTSLDALSEAGQDESAESSDDRNQVSSYKILDTFADGNAIIELGIGNIEGIPGAIYRLVSLEEGVVVHCEESGEAIG